MGLDTVETVLWAEKEFGIEISDEDASAIRTVGEFSSHIRQQLLLRDSAAARSEADIFGKIKQYLVSHLGVRVERITREAEFVKDLGLE